MKAGVKNGSGFQVLRAVGKLSDSETLQTADLPGLVELGLRRFPPLAQLLLGFEDAARNSISSGLGSRRLPGSRGNKLQHDARARQGISMDGDLATVRQLQFIKGDADFASGGEVGVHGRRCAVFFRDTGDLRDSSSRLGSGRNHDRIENIDRLIDAAAYGLTGFADANLLQHCNFERSTDGNYKRNRQPRCGQRRRGAWFVL